jgi:hypothetical protein
MDLRDVLAQLRGERDALDSAIANLERLENERHRNPGRQPSLVTRSSNDGKSNGASNGTSNGTNHGYTPPSPAPGEG